MSFPAPDLGNIKMELFAGWNWFLFCSYISGFFLKAGVFGSVRFLLGIFLQLNNK